MLRINWDNLRKSHETPWLILDLVMLGVLFINLAWLLFDSLYGTAVIHDQLEALIPGFTHSYDPIHKNFIHNHDHSWPGWAEPQRKLYCLRGAARPQPSQA